MAQRRTKAEGDSNGTGGGDPVVVAVIMGIHALGGLDYHPTEAEAEYVKARNR